MQVINVIMNDVEFAGSLRDLFDEQDVVRHRVDAALVQAERPGGGGDQAGGCFGVAARE